MAADGDGVFAFDKEISKMLIGPFVQRVQNAVGHQPMFTRQGIELGASPNIATGELMQNSVEFAVECAQLFGRDS